MRLLPASPLAAQACLAGLLFQLPAWGAGFDGGALATGFGGGAGEAGAAVVAVFYGRFLFRFRTDLARLLAAKLVLGKLATTSTMIRGWALISFSDKNGQPTIANATSAYER